MAYKTSELKQKAKKAIKEHNLIFIADIIAYLPCTSSTFYEHFPSKSDDYKELDELLEENKVRTKNSLRSKWYKSDNATLQVILYKLMADTEEHKRISKQYIDHTSDDKPIPILGAIDVPSSDVNEEDPKAKE